MFLNNFSFFILDLNSGRKLETACGAAPLKSRPLSETHRQEQRLLVHCYLSFIQKKNCMGKDFMNWTRMLLKQLLVGISLGKIMNKNQGHTKFVHLGVDLSEYKGYTPELNLLHNSLYSLVKFIRLTSQLCRSLVVHPLWTKLLDPVLYTCIYDVCKISTSSLQSSPLNKLPQIRIRVKEIIWKYLDPNTLQLGIVIAFTHTHTLL